MAISSQTSAPLSGKKEVGHPFGTAHRINPDHLTNHRFTNKEACKMSAELKQAIKELYLKLEQVKGCL